MSQPGERGRYRVAAVRAADDSPAPPEIAERFEGRVFSPLELEQRGIRITGAGAWYFANGQDWQLTLDSTV